MTKELLHGSFNEMFEQFKPGLKSAVHGVITGDANFEELFDEDDNPITNLVKDKAEEQLEAVMNQIHAKAKEELIDRFHLSPKDQDAVSDFAEGMQDLIASDAVQTLFSELMPHETEAGAIKTTFDTEMKGFVDNLVKNVMKPEFNTKAFAKKSDQLFKDFALQLHDETNFDTTTVIKPLVDELRALTKTFAESTRDKTAVAVYRKSFTDTITKHDAIFTSKSTSSANHLYSLVFEVLRAILALVTPFLPDSAQETVNSVHAFFAPAKNANSDVLGKAAGQLNKDLAHHAVVVDEEEEQQDASDSHTMH